MKVADKNEEMLQVLTTDGEFTGEKKPRGFVHDNGIYHQEVGFIPITIIDGGGMYFYRKEVKTKNNIRTAGLFVQDMWLEMKQRLRLQ